MEKVTVADWDLAEVIETKEDVVASLDMALTEKDTGFLFETLGALARSEGMSQLAKELGVTREGLYKSLSPNGHPSFETVLNLLDLLGLQLRVEPKSA